MSPLLVVGVVVAVMMVAGAGIALVAGGRTDVDERLEQFTGTTILEVDEQVDVDRAGPDVADRLDKVLSGQGFFGPIRQRLSRSDLKLRVSEYLVLVALSGVAAGTLAYFFFDRNWVLAVIAGVVGLRLPRFYVNFAASRRINAFNNQLGDTLNLWVNALRSGYSVLQGMEAIATELPPPVSMEFERVVQEVRLGLPMEEALENMNRRVPSEDLDLVITAVNIQREVGGNLAEVLDSISFTIRERVRIKGEIRTLTAQGRISGWIITFLPVALGVVLYGINPDYISELWVREEPFLLASFPCGWLVMGVAVFMMLMGGLAIRKIVDIEV